MSVTFANEIARGVFRCHDCGLVWWRGDCTRTRGDEILCPECRTARCEKWAEEAKSKADRRSLGKENISLA